MVVVPTVLFFNHNAFIILTLNILMYIVLFEGNIYSQIIHFVGVYLLTNMTESMVFGIGAILLSPSLKHSEISAVRSGEFSLFFAVVITGFILYMVIMGTICLCLGIVPINGSMLKNWLKNMMAGLHLLRPSLTEKILRVF